MQKRPKNIDVNHALGLGLAYKQNDLKKAQEHMQVALRTGSKDPELLQQAGAIELALGQCESGQ